MWEAEPRGASMWPLQQHFGEPGGARSLVGTKERSGACEFQAGSFRVGSLLVQASSCCVDLLPTHEVRVGWGWPLPPIGPCLVQPGGHATSQTELLGTLPLGARAQLFPPAMGKWTRSFHTDSLQLLQSKCDWLSPSNHPAQLLDIYFFICSTANGEGSPMGEVSVEHFRNSRSGKGFQLLHAS